MMIFFDFSRIFSAFLLSLKRELHEEICVRSVARATYGSAKGDYFERKILPEDIQIKVGQGSALLSARYMLDEVDSIGQT